MSKFKVVGLIIVLMVLLLFGVFMSREKDGEVENIVFADLSWNSVQVHNRIAAFIIENGIGGYKADYTPGDTLVSINGVAQGDIDVDMESWHSNYRDVYDKAIASGQIVNIGKNLPDAPQGWWVPRYLVEGADAQAPDLKSVRDLPRYWELFRDPEDKNKGLVYMGVAGWASSIISEEIFHSNGLGENFNKGIPGSSVALAAAMTGAYEKREAWVGYYWAPSAVLGRLDMVRLKGSEYEPADVDILVNKSFLERAPKVIEFLKNYSTTIADNNEFLAKMDSMEWDTQETAIWFLNEKSDIWTQWVSDDIKTKVQVALKALR